MGIALLLFDLAGGAENKPATNVATPLERAQDLFLHKRRKEALRLLMDSKLLASGKPAEREAIKEGLVDLSTRFLTDKGQKGFELGQSHLPNQAGLAINSLKEAETLEDGNLLVLLALARAYLVSEDCRSARKTLEPSQELLPYFGDYQEIDLILAWCLEDVPGAEEAGRRKAGDQKLSPGTLKINSAWLKWMKGEKEKIRTLTKEAVQAEPQNPAVLYWSWKFLKDSEIDDDALAPAQALVHFCKAKEPDLRRRRGTMIEICLRSSEVEAYLKSKGAESNDAG